MKTLDRAKILLSVQCALLGTITPEIRVIDVSWNDREIRLRFTVDTDGDYDMFDLVNEVEAEVEGDFLPDARVTSEVIRLPVGTPVPVYNLLDGGSARAFARSED